MELPTFIALLAFLPMSTPSDPDLPPTPPNISVTPPKAEFLIGDAVSLTCTAPGGRVRGFRFSGSSGWVLDVRSSRRSFSHTFNISGTMDGGFHSCSYTLLRPGRADVHSPPSRAVVINVRDRPSQPILVVTPSSVTVEGQPLVFSCQAPPGAAQRRFGIFQEELEVTAGIWEGSGSSGVRLRVERSGRNQTGNFSCRYEEMTQGRWIASYPSDAVQVIVKDPCPPPVLSVEPLSGVVATGHRLRLSCAAPRRHFRRRFRFFRDGAEVTPGAGDVIGGAGEGSELLFPRISREFAGNFSCRVEEEVGGAWLEAPPSRGVAVEVRAQLELLPLVIGTAVGVASLLLGLLLAACLCRKRRGGSRWRGLRPGEDTGTFSMGDLEVAS
ncbi:immunoglobulin superfamily member 1-like isoform X2 [Poecile atricapillus]|uniref:immunoglobulin superfamily member 1-like isoform X2 n=1 Tax=Poecile atricapillus TaxID=48891 RepID=UPI002738B63F|nr:immunoglobulin superfamily member 1-like isoform X2 [Poecile atricapillus]